VDKIQKRKKTVS